MLRYLIIALLFGCVYWGFQLGAERRNEMRSSGYGEHVVRGPSEETR